MCIENKKYECDLAIPLVTERKKNAMKWICLIHLFFDSAGCN